MEIFHRVNSHMEEYLIIIIRVTEQSAAFVICSFKSGKLQVMSKIFQKEILRVFLLLFFFLTLNVPLMNTLQEVPTS